MKTIRLKQSLFAVIFLAVAHGAFAVDLQQPPTKIPENFPQLAPLLKNSEGKTISKKSDWETQRQKIKADWSKVMGVFPKERAPLKTEFLEKEEFPDFTRQFVRYQIENGVFEDGYLLTPKNLKGKLPAIVVFHPTTPFQARGVAGLEPEYAEEKRQGIHLVQRGYVVWCPRNFIFDDAPGAKKESDKWILNTKKIQRKHPTWIAMARMTFDGIRAADFVVSLPNVDTNRIGCIGHSLGGKMALYAPAFDERYKASVSSEGGIGLRFSNWNAIWYFGTKIDDPKFALENHQVLALVAPRAFLLLAGDASDNDKSWAFIESVRPVYALYGKPENVGWFNHHQGHRYSPEAREAAEKFFDAHLKK